MSMKHKSAPVRFRVSGYKVLGVLAWLALTTVVLGSQLAFTTLFLGFVLLVIKGGEMLRKDGFTLNNSTVERDGMYWWITKQEEKRKNG